MIGYFLLTTVTSLIIGACGSSQWYVNNTIGHDTENCGVSQKIPCRTIRYTVPQTQPNDVINIDTSRGPYQDEGSNSTYVHVNHSLTLRAIGAGHARITCRLGQSKIFLVSTSNLTNTKTVMTLHNVDINNCQFASKSDTGVIMVHNARLVIVESAMSDNFLLVHHPMLTMPGCDLAEVEILNSTMTKNQKLPRPFLPGVLMEGCGQVSIQVINTTLKGSPLRLTADRSLNVMMRNVSMEGSYAGGSSSVDITMANETNIISITNCTVTGHNYIRDSPVNLALTQKPSKLVTVHLTNVRFTNNSNIKSHGAALSLISHFNQPRPLIINAILKQCEFSGNLALEGYYGGAVYMKNVANLTIYQCMFTNNTASMGGAVFAEDARGITILSSGIVGNRVVSKGHTMTMGGGIFAHRASITARNTSFINNKVSSRGSHIYGTDLTTITLLDCNLTQQDLLTDGWLAYMIYMGGTQKDDLPLKAGLTMDGNILSASGSFSRYPFLYSGIRTKLGSNMYKCPSGHHINYTSIQPLVRGPYSYEQLAAFCSACPAGEFSLKKHVWNGTLDIKTPDFKSFCSPCPSHAECVHGQIWPHYNYWLHTNNTPQENKSANDVLVYLCSHEECNGNQPYDSGNSCSSLRKGRLCSSCLDGYIYSMSKHGCVIKGTCNEQYTMYIAIAGFFCVYVLLILFMLKLWKMELMNQSNNHSPTPSTSDTPDLITVIIHSNHDLQEDSDVTESLVDVTDETPSRPDPMEPSVTTKKSRLSVPAIGLLACLFIQIAPLVYTPLSIPQLVFRVVIGVYEFFSFQLMYEALPNVCEFESMNGLSRWVLGLATPLALLLILALLSCVCMAYNKCMSRRGSAAVDSEGRGHIRASSAPHYMSAGFTWLVFACYIPMLCSACNLLHCRPYNNGFIINVEKNMTCPTPWQIPVLVFILVFLAPLPVALALASNALHQNKSGKSLILVVTLPLVYVLWYCVNKCKSPAEPVPSSEPLVPASGHLDYDSTSNPNKYSMIFHLLILKPFNTYRKAGTPAKTCGGEPLTPVNGLAILLIKCMTLTCFGVCLGHLPILKAFIITILSLLFLVRHLTTDKPMGHGMQQAVTLGLSLITILSFLNIYCSTLYEYSYHEDTGLFANLRIFCEVVYVIAMLGAAAVIACVVLVTLMLWGTYKSFMRCISPTPPRPRHSET